jgi:hypothetical protein
MLCPACCEFRFPKESAADGGGPAAGSNDHSDMPAYVCCELLYFVQNKCGVLTFDRLVNICTNFYTCTEVEAARLLLADVKRLSKHNTGSVDERRERTVIDIVKLCLTPSTALPVFYSVNMSRIPPVGIEHVDVSALLQEVSSLRQEVRALTDVRSTVAELRKEVHSFTVRDELQISGAVPVDVEKQTVKPDITMPPSLNPSDAATSFEMTATHRSSTIPSFASMASSLQTSGMAEKPRKKTHRPVVGRSTNTSRLKSVVTKKSVDVFVSRLSPDTVSSEVEQCVTDILGDEIRDIEIVCTQLKPKFENLYSSFFVSVSVDVRYLKRVIEQLHAADSWPDGVLVRRYFRPKNE